MPENAVAKPNAHRREEKLWSEIKNYQVATNNARILGVLDELIINEKTGKIVDIAVKVEPGRNVHVKGAKRLFFRCFFVLVFWVFICFFLKLSVFRNFLL